MNPSIEIQPTNYAPSSGGCGLGGFLEVENLWAKYVCSSGGQTTHTLRLKSDLTTDWFDVDTAFPTLNVSNAGDWMVCLYTNGSCVAYAMAVLAQEGSSAWQTHIGMLKATKEP